MSENSNENIFDQLEIVEDQVEKEKVDEQDKFANIEPKEADELKKKFIVQLSELENPHKIETRIISQKRLDYLIKILGTEDVENPSYYYFSLFI